MIKINLLPKEERKKKVSKKVELKISKEILKRLVLPIGITIVLLGAIFAYMELTQSSLKKDIEKQKFTLSQLQKKIEEVKKFESLNKDVENKIKIVEDLRKMQATPVTILNNIVKKIPDGVWLAGITYDGAITIEGYGFSNLNVVAFVENLKGTPEFQDVSLVESQQTEYDKVPVYKFIVKCNLKG